MKKTLKTKNPYKKPKIKSEKIIETSALACGKCMAGNPIAQFACRMRPRMS